MIKVVVRQRPSQPEWWYIDEISDIGVTPGKVGYKSSSEARIVAKKKNPYVGIEVQP